MFNVIHTQFQTYRMHLFLNTKLVHGGVFPGQPHL
jgi:hypothetical protein